MRRRNKRKTSTSYFPCEVEKLEKDLKEGFFKSLPDFTTKKFEHEGQKVFIAFINYMVEKEQIYRYVIEVIQQSNEPWGIEKLKNEIPISDGELRTSLKDVGEDLIKGSFVIYIEGLDQSITYAVPQLKERDPDRAETESLILDQRFLLLNPCKLT